MATQTHVPAGFSRLVGVWVTSVALPVLPGECSQTGPKLTTMSGVRGRCPQDISTVVGPGSVNRVQQASQIRPRTLCRAACR
ncbi:hypothetical protein C8Q73DRAFT_100124 [Cubamyces lactineus]|nr:hypothetical protein C8Q73DRAFT_100124 [Cubamyces lactineus]